MDQHKDMLDSIDSSTVGKVFSFHHLPDLPSLTKWLPEEKVLYAEGRHNNLKRSLLTATLYLQRPLTEKEVDSVMYWSTKESNCHRVTGFLMLFALSLGLHPGDYVISSLARQIVRFVTKGHIPAQPYTRARAVEDLFYGSVWSVGLGSPWAVRSNYRQKQMKDPRLKSLRVVEWGNNTFTLSSISLDDGKVPLSVMKRTKRPSFWETFFGHVDGSEWQRLKYAVSTFADSPPVAEGGEEQAGVQSD